MRPYFNDFVNLGAALGEDAIAYANRAFETGWSRDSDRSWYLRYCCTHVPVANIEARQGEFRFCVRLGNDDTLTGWRPTLEEAKATVEAAIKKELT